MRLFNHLRFLSSDLATYQKFSPVTRWLLLVLFHSCLFVLYGLPPRKLKKVIAGRVKLVKVGSHLIVNSFFWFNEKLNSNELQLTAISWTTSLMMNILFSKEIVMNLLQKIFIVDLLMNLWMTWCLRMENHYKVN